MMTTTPSSTTTIVTVDSNALSVYVAATTDVDAPAHVAWAVLADTDKYAEWNPFVRRLDGDLVVGNKIEVELQLNDRKLQKMSPRIVVADAGTAFEWLGGFGFRGVFDGRHRFEIQAVDVGRSRLVQSEKLSGALVPFFRKMLTCATPAAFVACNDAFKQRVEDAR